ncbi:hypothetical protein K469DRAFT_664384 [Zopfia rhizophila CBS 207.26]|uniref:CorA-like transporter domain-containing protein n=1 Tax=Zopfia rhizophila CBS 207.26 TaxID=1314779 RepID=A0A6A6E5Y2_9PEZI|nr:hypothetical protein K469DRAFT_664384 [Zopfia rhizophila CBS 207.26]
MDHLLRSCDGFRTYPQNLIQDDLPEENLKSYSDRLKEQDGRLFCDETEAAIEFIEIGDGDNYIRSCRLKTLSELQHQLNVASEPTHTDPKCRFIFIHASHRKGPLCVSREMLCFAFSYHQVLPQFMDFVFSFENYGSSPSLHLPCFREEDCLDPQQGLQVPELGRSGHQLRICYNLQSVERIRELSDPEWVIQHTAVYQTFDLDTGQSLWIILKGNEVMHHRISKAIKSASSSKFRSFGSAGEAFLSSLLTHSLLCDWAGENWRWYVNDLENELQVLLKKPVLAPIYRSSPVPDLKLSSVSRRAISGLVRARTLNPEIQTPRNSALYIEPEENTAPPSVSSTVPKNAFLSAPQPSSMSETDNIFADLQSLQLLDDKMQEALLVFKQNTEVLQNLRQYYLQVTNCTRFPAEVGLQYQVNIMKFEKRILSVEKDILIHQTRTETLLRRMADRKNLVCFSSNFQIIIAADLIIQLYGLLQYQSFQGSVVTAQKAQGSADRMEVLTMNMNEIAAKTKQDIVSVRVSVLTTLFFLPASVISSFMSTDIIKFNTDGTRNFQHQGLRLFLSITLPLMTLTFLMWYLVYWWAARKDRRYTMPIDI